MISVAFHGQLKRNMFIFLIPRQVVFNYKERQKGGFVGEESS